jgi:hypothetical protein
MRKLAIGITGAVALLLAGILAWNAQATPLIGSTTLRSAASHSLVEKAACVHQGPLSRCPLGQHWNCGPQGCGCVPCPESITCPPAKPYICKRMVSGRPVYFCSPIPCPQWHRP